MALAAENAIVAQKNKRATAPRIRRPVHALSQRHAYTTKYLAAG
jgi:hypothetical protein